MTESNKQFLDLNRHHYDVLIKAFYLRHLDGNTRAKMQQVMSDEFQPGYATDLWCPPCVSDMVKALYRRYDEWIAANKKPERASPEPLIVEANFPSNKTNENESHTPNGANPSKRSYRRRK